MGFGLKKIKKAVKKTVKKVGNIAGDIADATKNIPGINALTSQLALLDSPSKFADIWKSSILPQYALGAAGAIGAGGLSGALSNLGFSGLGSLGGAISSTGIPDGGFAIGNTVYDAAGNIVGENSAGDGSLFGSIGKFLGGGAGAALPAALGGLLGYTSSGDLKSTTKNDIPAWQKEHVLNALGGARALYDTGTIAQVAPLSAQTTAAIGRATDSAALDPYKNVQSYLQGTLDNPKQSQSADYYKDVLGGKYLNGNPHLDAVIGRAQDDVQSRIDSQFASGGRLNSGAAQRALATGLGDISDQMRYSDYNNERGRMDTAAAGLTGIDQFNQNYGLQATQGITNAQNGYLAANNAALNAGGVIDAQNQRLLDAPYEAVQRYLQSITGNYGGTTTAVQPQNRTLNTLAGVAAGASLFGNGGLFG